MYKAEVKGTQNNHLLQVVALRAHCMLPTPTRCSCYIAYRGKLVKVQLTCADTAVSPCIGGSVLERLLPGLCCPCTMLQ